MFKTMKKLKIKNDALIEKTNFESKSNTTTYLVKKGVKYLSEVISELPNGIINKGKTGTGGTTLELQSKRNSIVVQPLKITASEKAKKTPGSLYIGSSTDYFKEVKDEEILDYLKNPAITYKKIICVADSLPRLMRLIAKEKLVDIFFLLIDESDSIQIDSGFRKTMEDVVRIYKRFEKSNRAMISATPIEMYDPELKNERKTVFEFEDPTTYEIQIERTANSAGNVIDAIIRIHTSDPDAKIVIAYNSVQKIKALADHLVSKCGYLKSEVTILCGNQSKSLIKGFNNIFSLGKLTTRITLKTSAYYTGFDVDEPYHLITISDNKDHLNSPSIERLFQIAGRCRSKLESFTIVQVFDESHSYSPIDLKEILKNAEDLKAKFKCLTSKKSKNSPGKIIAACEAFRNHMDIEGYALVSLYFNGKSFEFETSFLSVDALMKLDTTRNLVYDSPISLYTQLMRVGCIVKLEEIDSSTKINGFKSLKTITKIEKQSIEEAIPILSTSLPEIIEESKKSTSKFKSLVFDIFLKNYERMDRKQLIGMIESASNSTYFKHELIRLEEKLDLYFLFKSDPNKKMKETFFPIGKRIYVEDLESETMTFLECCDLQNLVSKFSKLKTMDMLKSILKLEEVRFNKKRLAKGEKNYFKVKSYNPFDSPIKSRTYSLSDFAEFYGS